MTIIGTINEVGDMCTARSSRWESDEGGIAVIVAVLIVVLMAFAAVAVDAGAMYSQRRQMQTAADAAALAGAQNLPSDPSGALSIADEYALDNMPDADDRSFTVESTYGTNDTLVAEVRQTAMGLFFARFMGVDSAPVGATAMAMVGSPRTYGSGLMPFGIVASQTVSPPYGYDTGTWITLVVDTGDQSQGNWHYVDLTPFTDNANNTSSVIENGGTTDPVSIGDFIDTQPGKPNNPNFKALNTYFTCAPHDVGGLAYDEERGVYEPAHASDGSFCPRLVTCPMVVIGEGDPYDWEGTAGKSVSVKVVGFVNMFINNDPNFKDGALVAKFVQVVPVDTLDPGAYVDYAGVVWWLER